MCRRDDFPPYLLADEPCAKDECGWACWSETSDRTGETRWVRDHSWGTGGYAVDGEAFCGCDHHAGTCPVRSSVTDARCLLPIGHPQDSPTRFHRYGVPG